MVVVRRPVKHVRLRVDENCSLEAIVPLGFTDPEIQAVLNAKANWIERARSFFRTYPAKMLDDQNALRLFGEPFAFVSDGTLGRAIVVDEKARVIRSARNFQVEAERLRWCRMFARQFLRQRIKDLAAAHKFSFNRIYVMNQRTVWGNCSKKQNVSLNWQLIRAPQFVIDYVILHELLHTRFMNHGQLFWRSMSRLCERHKNAIAWLHANRPVVCAGK
jgi:predicted metal-dependent hydrolase